MLIDKNDLETYKYSMRMAADWLVEFGQKHEPQLTTEINKRKLRHDYWKGAIRGEFSLAEGKWSFFCPIWHTGQAIKSLLMAYKVHSEKDYLDALILGLNFIIHNSDRSKTSEDYGLIYAYEDRGDIVNTSAILEALDGIINFHYFLEQIVSSKVSTDIKENDEIKKKIWEIFESIRENLHDSYNYDPSLPKLPNLSSNITSNNMNNPKNIKSWEKIVNFLKSFSNYLKTFVIDAVDWVINKQFEFVNENKAGILYDYYFPEKKKRLLSLNETPKDSENIGRIGRRPLADDAIFLKAFQLTQNEEYLNVFKSLLQTLMDNEFPKGNWIKYPPANKKNHTIHPRHAYWWGLPFLDAYLELGNTEYLGVFIRATIWYMRAMRGDGGIFRNTFDFGDDAPYLLTESFGHATSGSAVGVTMMIKLYDLISKIKNNTTELHVADTNKGKNNTEENINNNNNKNNKDMENNQGDDKLLKDLQELGYKDQDLDSLKQKLEEHIRKGARFCFKMQMTMPENEELYGVIIEKILPLDGSDKNPLYIRDLGTIFYIQMVYNLLFSKYPK
ncbi:MAG: hypothetical protein ACTSU2_06815 [Promethearchaeota archaeon]